MQQIHFCIRPHNQSDIGYILIRRYDFDPEMIKRYRGVIKNLSAFFAKIHLGVYDQSKSIIDTWDKSIYM